MQWFGWWLGVVWYHLIPIRRGEVLQNLGLAFPELDSKQRKIIAARTFQNVAMTVLEIFWIGQLTPRRLDGLVEVHGLEHYEKLRREGRGVVAVTAHLGNWDLLACSQALSGVPLSIVTKDLKTGGVSTLWMERRKKTGVKLLAARGSALALMRALKRGEVVGLVVDQRTPAHEGGAPLPFFGSTAMTTLAPHRLAQRSNAALVPVWTYRRSDGSHVVTVGKEIPRGATAEETMTTINTHLEAWIRQKPDQWLWLHRRWKT